MNAFVIRSYYEHFNLQSLGMQEACRGAKSIFFESEICKSSDYSDYMLDAMMIYDAQAIFRESLARLQLSKKTITPDNLAAEMKLYVWMAHTYRAKTTALCTTLLVTIFYSGQ